MIIEILVRCEINGNGVMRINVVGFLLKTQRIVRKVKLILESLTSLDLGKLCNQLLCVASFITSKLPCSSTSGTICLVCLCLNKGYKNILLLDVIGLPNPHPIPLKYQISMIN
jgi:hypothetical protein